MTNHAQSNPLIQPAAFQKTLTMAIVIPIVAMILLAALLAYQITSLLDAAQYVENSNEIIAQANLVLQLMIDEETGQRGYLVGGDPKFLQPYREGQTWMPAVFNKLQELVDSKPEQAQRVKEIRSEHDRWLAEARQEMARVNDPPAKRAYFNQGLGKKLMDAQRHRISEFISLEADSRQKRDRHVQSVARTALLSSIGASLLLGVGLAGLTRQRLHRLSSTFRHALTEEQQSRQQTEAAQKLVQAKSDQLAQANNELATLNTELEARVLDRTAQLEASNKELEAFAYSVSHDLRAPLRSLDGFSSALIEDYGDKFDGMGKTYLQRLRANSKQMGELIDGMLALSRLTRAEMRVEPVDLSAMAHEVAEALQRTNLERKAEFVIADNIHAQGDARLLRNVLENLIGNAFKFTAKRDDARIEFGATERDGKPLYFVRDNGAGFDMAYVGKLFGAFQRLHGAKEFEGTGIGLATVQRIIRRHGGQIEAESAVGQGAMFSFTLA